MSTDEDDINSALSLFEEDLRSILSTIAGTPGTEETRATLLADSAFALGYRARSEMHGSVQAKYGGLGALEGTVEALTNALLSNRPGQEQAFVEAVEAARNDLAAFGRRSMASVRNMLRTAAKDQLGARAASLIYDHEAIDDHEAADIGFSAATSRRGGFYAFAVFAGDTSMRCRCPQCVLERLVKEGISEEDAERRLRERFPDKAVALVAYGHYMRHWLLAGVETPHEASAAAPLDTAASQREMENAMRLFRGEKPDPQ